MANVFFNPYAGQSKAWSLQNCFIFATNKNDAKKGILAATENVQITFGRQIDTRYPLTGDSPIKTIGVPQGNCVLTTILGPDSQVDKFLQLFGSNCKTFDLTVATQANNLDPNCQTNTSPHKLVMKGCMGQQMSFQLSMQNNITVAQGTFSILFDALDWSNTKV